MTKPQKWLTGVAITGVAATVAAAVMIWILLTAISR
jgi:hypothetical protein